MTTAIPDAPGDKALLPVSQFHRTCSIPEGMRAVNIRVYEISGISRKLRKGDLTDVIAVNFLSEGEGKVSRTLLQKVEIWDRGDTEEEEDEEEGLSEVISLLVTPEQAAVIAACSKTSRFKIFVRNPKDIRETKTAPAVFTPEYGAGLFRNPEDDICQKIPMNMRAVSVPVTDKDGICSVLRRGDRVDILFNVESCVFKMASGAIDDYETDAKVTLAGKRHGVKTVFQDLEILVSDRNILPGPDADMPVNWVTVLVTPKEAEALGGIVQGVRGAVVSGIIISRNKNDRTRKTDGFKQLIPDKSMIKKRQNIHKTLILNGVKKVKVEKFY